MVATFTANLALTKPGNGDDVNFWDQPLNSDFDILDAVMGTAVSVPVSNAPISLSAAQYNSVQVIFTGTLSADVTVTFPAVGRFYMINNTATQGGFVIKLKTGAGNQICAPPGVVSNVVTDASNVAYASLGQVGTYWDYCGATVPRWISQCSIPPYLNCDGTTFSSAVYPNLRDIIGTNTLPDTRGRLRAALNQGQGRLTTAGSGVNGNTLFAGGGSESNPIAQVHLPNLGFTITANSQNVTLVQAAAGSQLVVGGGGVSIYALSAYQAADVIFLNGNQAQLDYPTVPPAYIGGLTLVRAG